MQFELGRCAYNAYCDSVDWKSFNGDRLPSWEKMLAKNPKIANAWECAGLAVKREIKIRERV